MIIYEGQNDLIVKFQLWHFQRLSDKLFINSSTFQESLPLRYGTHFLKINRRKNKEPKQTTPVALSEVKKVQKERENHL